MKQFYACVIFFTAFLNSFAQPDTAKYNLLISNELIFDKQADRIVRISDSLSNVSKIQQRDFLVQLNKAAVSKGNSLMEAHSANNLALVYLDFGMYSEAYDLFNRALNIYTKEKRSTGVFNVYSNFGSMYFYMGDMKKSLIYNLKSLQYFKDHLNTPEHASRGASACLNLGGVYGTMGNLPLARTYFYKALEYYNVSSDKDSITRAMIMNNIGDTYLYQEDYENAEKFLKVAGELKFKYGSEEQKADGYNGLGVFYYSIKDYKKALDYFRNTLKHTDTSNLTSDLVKYYRNLADIHGIMNDHKTESKFLKLTIRVRNYLDSVGKVSEIEANDIKNQFRQTSVRDSIQNKAQLRVRDVKLQQKKRESIFGIIALLTVSIVAFLFFNRYKLTRKQKLEIEEQKHLVDEKNKEIRDSINYAKNLQNALMPEEEELLKTGTEAFVLYLPKDIVAGDFYWWHKFPHENKLLIAAADCTGHGVPGAMVSVVCINALNRAVNEFNLVQPNEILDKVNVLVNETFSKNNKNVNDGMDISLLLIDRDKNEVKWCGANNQLISFSGSEMKITRADKQPIGKNENHKPFTLHTFPIEKGTVYYLVTDGFADQFGGDKNKKMGISKVKTLMTDNHTRPMKEQRSLFEIEFKNWKRDTEQTDDVSLIGIRV